MRINLHWGISNLVSFTIIVTMLGNKQFLHGRRETVSLLDVLPRKEPCVQPPASRVSMQDEFSNTCYGREHASA
jgi:hypothetical protein